MLRGWVFLLLVSSIMVAPLCAHAAYTEAHIAGVDARVRVERDGRVVVTHAIGYRVLAGALRSIAIAGLEEDWRPHATATVTSSDAHSVNASVARDDKGVLHVTVDDARGLKRGDYRFELTYEGVLGPRLTRDGAFDRVRFSLPPMHEGVDGARVVFELPAAPTEPRAITEGDTAADLSTLRRSAERDTLELVRPHVPKEDAAAFFVRVDPKALSQIEQPRATESATPTEAPAPSRLGVAILASIGALVVFALGLAKGRLLRSCAARGLLPGPAVLRSGAAAVTFGAGVLAETDGRLILGAGLIAAALPWLAWRVRSTQAGARIQATWLVVKPEEAFARHSSRADALDATTRIGMVVLVGVAVALAAACYVARGQGGGAAYLVAIDALVVIPVFFTGTSLQMPRGARREGLALAPVARVLGAHDDLRVSPFARVIAEGETEELRLLVSPRLAMSGVSAIEVGVAWESAGGAILPFYDVLLRVHDDSFAAAKLTTRFPTKRALPGRKPDERVYRFEPESPSTASAAAMVLTLADVVRDRRLVIPARFDGVDRRLPPKRAATNGASLA